MKNLIEFLKIAAKDKVDMIALLILLIVAIVDLFTDIDLTGGYSETYFKFIFRPIENESINYLSNINTSTVAIYVNAPNITTMTFNGITFFQKLWFCDNMDSWAGGTLIFANLKRITELTLPKSMNSVTTMNSWFNNSIIPEIVLPESMPALFGSIL